MTNDLNDITMIDEDPRIGSVLNGRYRIVERIGSGGMGVVYRAERLGLDKLVAIKFLQEFFTSNEKFLARFKREAKATSKLNHPYCVSVIDFGVAGAPYIVMDYVDGENLKDVMGEDRFDVCEAVKLVSQILSGIAHAHSNGIIHRDIKPANVMLCQAEGLGQHARIFDFGLAKLLDSTTDAAQTMTAVVLGTPNYMSPEQSLGSDVDGRTDLYSAGILLFELLVGQRPFVDESAEEVLRQHRNAEVPKLAEVDVATTFSQELEAVVAKSLEKLPRNRFQTAAEFLEQLRATPESDGVSALSEAPAEAVRSPRNSEEGTEPTLLVGESDNPRQQTTLLEQTRIYFEKPRRKLLAASVLIVIGILAVLSWGTMFKMGSTALNKPRIADNPMLEFGSSHSPPPILPLEEKKPADSLDAVKAHIEAGEIDSAIVGLKQLRIEDPHDPSFPFHLGNLYFEKHWWPNALERYSAAIKLDRDYRKNKSINENAIEMLGTMNHPKKARAFLIDTVGRPALSYLKYAYKNHENPKVRRRAKAIADEIREQ